MARSRSIILARSAQSFVGFLLLLGIGFITLVPLGFLILNSFNTSQLGQEISWGFEGWRQAFGAPQTIKALMYSVLLSARTFLGLAVAFLVSWLLIRVRIPASPFIEFSLWMAWFLPPLSVTIGWIALLDPHHGLINVLLAHVLPIAIRLNIYSFSGILWVHLTLLTVPVMTILLTPAFRQMDASFEESARTCGSGPLRTLRRIVLPLLWPTVLVVTIATFIRSLEAFEIEQIIGIPAGIYVYGTRIYDLVRWDPPLYSQAMALSTIFLFVLFGAVLLYQRSSRHHEFATLRPGGASFRPALIGKWRYFASGLLILWIAVSIYLPLAMVLIGSFMKFFGMFGLQQPFTIQHWAAVLGDPAFTERLTELFDHGVQRCGCGGCGLLGSRIFDPARPLCRSRDVESARLDSLGDPRNSARVVFVVDLSLRALLQFSVRDNVCADLLSGFEGYADWDADVQGRVRSGHGRARAGLPRLRCGSVYDVPSDYGSSHSADDRKHFCPGFYV